MLVSAPTPTPTHSRTSFSASLGTARPSILEVTEVEAGLGEEALEEAGPVLHLPEPGLDQRGQLADVVLGEVGQRSFQG